MSKYVINESTLTDIADAIRAKKGSDETILTENFASEIEALDNKVLKELIQRSIIEINIPEGTANIGYCAFYDCKKLESITVPESVTIISQSAFYNCSALKSIKLPKNLIYIGDITFANCSSCLLFDFSECTSIPSLGGTATFRGINANAKIVVPEDLFLQWINATNWVTYKDYITTPNNGFATLGGQYIANEGMTWGEWVNSNYSEGKFEIQGGNTVWEIGGYQVTEVTDDGQYIGVSADDKIIKGAAYIIS